MWAALTIPFLLLFLVLCLARVEERLFPPAPAEHEVEEREAARLPPYAHEEPYPRHPHEAARAAQAGVLHRQRAHYRGLHRASADVRALRHRDTRRPATRGGA